MPKPIAKFFHGRRFHEPIQIVRKIWHRHHWQLLIAVLFTAITLLLFPRGPTFEFSQLHEGDIYLGDQVIAPFTFSINKTAEEYEHDMQVARESIYPVFVRVDSIANSQYVLLQSFLGQAEGVLESLAPDSLKARQLQQIFADQKIVISEDGMAYLLTGFGQKTSNDNSPMAFNAYRIELERIMRDLHSIGILNVERTSLPEYVKKVSVRYGSDEMVEKLEDLYSVGDVKNVVLLKLREIEKISDPAVKIGYQILTAFLRPNLFFDRQDTDARIAEAVGRVPRARGTVLENERIIESHVKVTPEHIQKLKSLAAAKAERRMSESKLRRALPTVGKALIVVLSLGLLGIFMVNWRWPVYTDIPRVLLIAIILLLVVFLTHLANRIGASDYLIPAAMAPMLITVFFDARLGFVGAATMGILLGSLRGNEFVTVFVVMISSMAGILAVRKVRSRTWIFKAILYLAVAYVLTVSANAFLRLSPLTRLVENLSYGLLNALVCPILTYGLMVIFEYVFDVTTDATLLEYSDLNRPILRELALRAPGTYHHSILVGTLSEAAAEAIGANSLLARVGSYYHDIGKIEKPEYFVENQKGGKNPHEKLAPTMSCLVIINHVKRGIEIAESNSLPKALRDFIPQHHGTNLVTYFYQKAKDQGDGTEVQESAFRYPGPKPQLKETGIVMLADAVEAAARTLREPSVMRIRNIVSKIVADRFTSGELDECPLTLRDLDLIKENFERTLTGIFHGRIDYTGEQKDSANPLGILRDKRHTPTAVSLASSMATGYSAQQSNPQNNAGRRRGRQESLAAPAKEEFNHRRDNGDAIET